MLTALPLRLCCARPLCIQPWPVLCCIGYNTCTLALAQLKVSQLLQLPTNSNALTNLTGRHAVPRQPAAPAGGAGLSGGTRWAEDSLVPAPLAHVRHLLACMCTPFQVVVAVVAAGLLSGAVCPLRPAARVRGWLQTPLVHTHWQGPACLLLCLWRRVLCRDCQVYCCWHVPQGTLPVHACL